MTLAAITAERLEALHTRGWVAIPGVLAAPEIDALLAGVRGLWAQHGEPALFSQEERPLGPSARVATVGMSVFGAGRYLPGMTRILHHAGLVELLQAALGPTLEVELSAAILADERRPFFTWHNHIGGLDEPDWQHRTDLHFDRVERVAVTTYLTPVDDAHGVMLLHPRRLGDALGPPRPPRRERWPDEVPLRCAPGTTVVLDQLTWHAVTPMQRPGHRAFLSYFVRRAGLDVSTRHDPSVAAVLAADPGLPAAWRPAPAGMR